MDPRVVIGLVLAVAFLGAALGLAGISAAVIFQAEAWLLVIGGTLAAQVVSTPGAILRQTLADVASGLRATPLPTPESLVEYLQEICGFVRREGSLPLASILNDIPLPFLREGLTLVVDQCQPAYIQERMGADLDLRMNRDLDSARTLESAAGTAATMGMVGAVVGLIRVLQHPPAAGSGLQALGPGIATAFSATLLGLAWANLVLLPLAGLLRQRAEQQWLLRKLMLEGLLGISRGEHPRMLADRLAVFCERSHSERWEAIALHPVPSAQAGAKSLDEGARAPYSSLPAQY